MNQCEDSITPIFAVDPSAKRCLHYEEMDPFQADHYVTLDPDLLKTKELEIRSDLIDAQIDICTPDVLAQWSESFDYELPRAHFLHGVCLRYIAYPDPDAILDLSNEPKDARADAEGRAAAAFEAVIGDAANIQYDHYLLYYSREALPFLPHCLLIISDAGP